MTTLEKAAEAVRDCVFESDDVAEHMHKAAALRAARAVLMAVRDASPPDCDEAEVLGFRDCIDAILAETPDQG